MLSLSSTFSQDFEVAPVKLFFNAEPGQTKAIQIFITNHSNIKTLYNITLGDYELNNNGEKIAKEAGKTEHSLTDWIVIQPPYLEVNPNEKAKFLVSIQAPAGDYSTRWANIFVTTTKEQTALIVDKAKQTGLILSGQIILRAIQTPESNTNFKLKISNLNELSNNLDSNRVFKATIDNIGDKIANCKVILVASNLSNAQETKLDEVYCESYPDTQLIINLKMNKSLPPGKYALAAILDYGSKNNLEGTQMLLEVQ
jgi:hypothetical protein